MGGILTWDLRFEQCAHWSKLSSQTQYSRHKPHLCFLMRNDLYFYVGFAAKINSVSTHNIKFKKTEFSQKNHFKKNFPKSFLWKSIYIFTFLGPALEINFWFFFEKLRKIFQKIWLFLRGNFQKFLWNFRKKSKIHFQSWAQKREYINGFP